MRKTKSKGNAQKSYVTMNMASSIDGKTAAAARGPVRLGTTYDRRRMGEIRAAADAVAVGTGTFRAAPGIHAVGSAALRRQRLRAGRAPDPASVVVSATLDFPRNTPWERRKDCERHAFCGRGAPMARRRRLERNGVIVHQARGVRPQPKWVLEQLRRWGHRHVLLEGGGVFNGAFLRLGLVDRIYLTFCPVLIGGSKAPTIFDGVGFNANSCEAWRMVAAEPRGQEVYFIFDRGRGRRRSIR